MKPDHSELFESMDIYSPIGTRVRYTGRGGTQSDKDHANKHLTVDKVYTLAKSEVGGWQTIVYFIEVPDIGFNSVMFRDAS